jgi:hypothetical protein
MFKLRLLQLIAAIVLGSSLLANFAFAAGVCSAFVGGGWEGVARWINHITYEGRLQITEVSPGVVRATMPVVKHIYLRFVLDWLLMIALAFASFHLLKFCTRRIQAREAKA